jgi:hypothetical protein
MKSGYFFIESDVVMSQKFSRLRSRRDYEDELLEGRGGGMMCALLFVRAAFGVAREHAQIMMTTTNSYILLAAVASLARDCG